MPARSRSMAPRAGTGRKPASEGTTEGDLTIGVDMGGTKVLLAVVSPTGQVLSSHRHATDKSGSVDKIVGVVAGCVNSCLGPIAKEAKAIGAGIAAQIRQRDGMLLAAPNLPWENVPIRAKIEKATGLPTTVTNDVRAATFGEWRFGAGRGVDDLVCIFVGTGVGGGIVADGRLLYGASDTAGEVGHMTIVSDGRACHCRNSGCFEAYVGGWAIAERAQELAKGRANDSGQLRRLAGGVDQITAEAVAQAYRAGDPFSQELLESTVEYLAAGVVSVVNALNPKLLILGGGVIDGLPNLIPATEALVRQRAIAAALTDFKIVRAGLGDDAGVLGSAELARGLLPGAGRP
jgi:glucokinase